MKTVLTSGAFDLIHYGHIRLLEEAKRLGGPDAKLVVIVARDETIRRLKGQSPVILTIISASNFFDVFKKLS